MPQWVAGEIGYVLAIIGFVLIVREWFHVFNVQGNSLARENLRLFLREWREANDTGRGTAQEARDANIRRMRETVQRMKGYQRELFDRYVCTLASDVQPDDHLHVDGLDRAFAIGTPIEDEQRRPRRRKLMIIGAVFVVVGSLGQMVSTAPEPFGPFCRNGGWSLTCPGK